MPNKARFLYPLAVPNKENIEFPDLFRDNVSKGIFLLADSA